MDCTDLHFPAGVAWQTVKASKGRPISKDASRFGLVPRALPLTFTLTASGAPRAWSAHAPKALWRSWVDATEDNRGQAIVEFVTRFGDPLGQLTPDNPINTESWFPLLADLAILTDAWSAPDASTGISTVARADDAVARLRVAGFQHPAPLTVAVEASARPRVMLRADTLASFMISSATSALGRAAPMRRCKQCSVWFELPRIDTYFCSVVCRNAHYRAHAAQHDLKATMAMAAERAAERARVNKTIAKRKRGA